MTTLYYLIDPFMLRQFATIIGKGSDARGNFIITDITPAYVQAGGQEADNGYIVDKEKEFRFFDVRYFEGVVKHYIDNGFETFSDRTAIQIVVDENRRKKNSILHTAGHLVASVAYKIIPDATPIKGYHFANGSYVELTGGSQFNIDEVKAQLQNILNEEIKTQKTVSYEMITEEELKLKCPFIQPGIPKDKPLRIVNIETFFPIGCGGTHIQKLNEIPMLTITKLKFTKGIIRISYTCF